MDTVWKYFGADVTNVIDPFCGSCSLILTRPLPFKGVETVNDLDGHVTNVWRSIQNYPDDTAAWADGPVNELDLHSRHWWLTLSEDARAFREQMRKDPHHCDPQMAGWWIWGACCWIGGGWGSAGDAVVQQLPSISTPHAKGGIHGKAQPKRRPIISGDNAGSVGKGVHAGGPANWRQRPVQDGGADDGSARGVHGRPQLADAYAPGRGVHSGHPGTCAERRAWLQDWFRRLADRLRNVRVCCGSWERVCSSPSVTTRLGKTALFLDPPYSKESGRAMNLYAQESGSVAHEVREYCLEWGAKKDMRIILCGWAGEGHEALVGHGWREVAWKSQGGYANQGKAGEAEHRDKERLWISPNCVFERTLFD